MRYGGVTYIMVICGLGMISEESIIKIYRSLQYLLQGSNLVYGSSKAVYHSTGALVSFVVAVFTLIRYNHLLFVKSAMALPLLGIIAGSMFLPVLLMYAECIFADLFDSLWKSYRKKILNITRRNTRLHKAARSFTALTLKSGGQYYNVNRSTFMDWCNNDINQLVNLLVSF